MVKLEYFDREDFKKLIEWMNSEHLITNWAGSLFRYPLTEDSLEWYIRDTNNLENPDAFIYKAIDTTTGNTVGHISLGGISEKNRAARISRVLVGNTAERGKGYCTGMINAVLKIGFEELKLHRISLGVYDFNKSAIRCYEKCGFVKEGVMRDVLKYEDGTYWSLVEMGILEDEWRELHKKKKKEAAADCKDC
ncbi:GNAT family protein [Segetibacter sp.]|jgi:RimJ/RimL family protein N-acetyltransferase|uniref:GNAT family N-acetyltransferase n=1 Tax=Segetibacter sp. TaxID=2231182 RepID=UPI002611F926|nr:GNAT family protein [Segetibacter sp.]MCW3079847.1 aminoglycoside adenylyltransferase [Segetibacter sp.]